MLNLKPIHKIIQSYYQSLQTLQDAQQLHEGAVAPVFAQVLRYCASQTAHLELIEQYPLLRPGKPSLRTDGVLVDRQTKVLIYGVWEAKDTQDNLEQAIKKKFKDGYPKENILFQTPTHLVLYRHGEEIYHANISDSPANLINGLELFFDYQPPAYQQWEEAPVKFNGQVGELGKALVKILTAELHTNLAFQTAFEAFWKLCRDAMNPNLSQAAILEMLVQHLLTERLFRTVFSNPDFREKNVIAREIEKVIAQLTAKSFSRDVFLKSLDHFYVAIERAAATIEDYSRKQDFLNVIYEKFFQGFAVKVADTHGIVYTPQPIVDFIVQSVAEILKQEFNCSLSSPHVHILDPFVGTGNFILRVLREIQPLQLEHKYRQELHCNEVMLLPYYIACLNIEQAFFQRTGKYLPFEGICLVDTFELAEEKQRSLELFVPENTARVRRQQETGIMVILGNPPYNAGQVNENDNNKNRQYGAIEELVRQTYAKDSKATNKNALADVYVKAFAWATQRLKDQATGIVAFVTNNGFLDNVAFDGMRKHLAKEFSLLYLLDLGGNVRKTPGAQNVFGIRVGVSINILVKKPAATPTLFYAQVSDQLSQQAKLDYLSEKKNLNQIEWQRIQPTPDHLWLTAGLHQEFETFLPLGTKTEKATKNGADGVIFKRYSSGIKTSRDAWAYHFNSHPLADNMRRTIETYNEQVFKWSRQREKPTEKQELAIYVDNFVSYEDAKLSWSESLKIHLRRGDLTDFDSRKIRRACYRPFTRSYLYFDRIFNERVYVFPSIFPTPEAETENQVLVCNGVGSEKNFSPFISSALIDSAFYGGGTALQCFPFYTYSEDGSNRQENLTDWALKTFRQHYRSRKLTKWDIFYYVYGLLHHSDYRDKYAANLKRELPRIPYAPDFWAFAKAGRELANLHLHYDTQPAYPLTIEVTEPLTWRVQKMKLSKDKTRLSYNESVTITGIPAATFEYRLGNRSALEWVIDQYQVTQDSRSSIVKDPNRLEDEEYILRLIRQVVTVSLRTVEIVRHLPKFEE